MFLETTRSKRSTEYQSNLSPRDTKTDDSKYETSTDKDRIMELELELQQMNEFNEHLQMENASLRAILKDYEKTKTNEDMLTEKLELSLKTQSDLESKLVEINNENTLYETNFKSLQKEIQNLKRDNARLENTAEMSANHQETQIRLLKEALNKRNEDVKGLENNNEELVKLLEK